MGKRSYGSSCSRVAPDWPRAGNRRGGAVCALTGQKEERAVPGKTGAPYKEEKGESDQTQ